MCLSMSACLYYRLSIKIRRTPEQQITCKWNWSRQREEGMVQAFRGLSVKVICKVQRMLLHFCCFTHLSLLTGQHMQHMILVSMTDKKGA
jgi:hypothetical protein